MLMGDPGMPRAVATSGGRLQHRGDDSEVPDLLVVSYEFDEFVLTLEHSNYPRYMRKTESTIRRNDVLPYWTQNATRIEIYGTRRMMYVGRHGGGWQVLEGGGKVVFRPLNNPASAAGYRGACRMSGCRSISFFPKSSVARQACLPGRVAA